MPLKSKAKFIIGQEKQALLVFVLAAWLCQMDLVPKVSPVLFFGRHGWLHGDIYLE
jgi:hypothetical protein